MLRASAFIVVANQMAVAVAAGAHIAFCTDESSARIVSDRIECRWLPWPRLARFPPRPLL